MKVSLINPLITSAERYGFDIGAIGGHQAPLGLCYLAAFLQGNGLEVNLIDAEAERLPDSVVIERLKKFKPNAIGITSTTVAFYRALQLAQCIKSYNPAIPVIIGGSHVSANPDKTLSYKYFDFGILGEGEITFSELLRAIETGASVENIQGIAYRKYDQVVLTARRPYINNLDSLPFPARHLLFDIKRYRPPVGCHIKTPVISMITSRGCPYRCIFCDTNVFGHGIRYHSPGYMAAEIRSVISSYGAKEIAFVDDTFTIDTGRVEKIVSLISKFKIKWTCMTRANKLNRELLNEMKNAGCWQIGIGIESGNQQIRDFIKKDINIKDVYNTVKWSTEAGIYVKGFFMLGHPHDTLDTINDTIKLATSMPLSDVVVTIATPIPGTEFYKIAPKYGTFKNDDWRKYSYWMPVFIPNGLSKDILLRKQQQFYLRFYLRPQVIFRQILKIRSLPQLFSHVSAILKLGASFIKRKKLMKQNNEVLFCSSK